VENRFVEKNRALKENRMFKQIKKWNWKSFSCLLFAFLIFHVPIASSDNVNWFERGLSLLRAQQYNDAIEAFSLAIEIIPHDYEAYNNRGVAWFLKGGARQAIQNFNKALKINPYFAAAFSNRATVWFIQGDLDQAISDSNEALKINNWSFQAYFTRAASWEKKGDTRNAFKDYSRVREIKPGYVGMRSKQMKSIIYRERVTAFTDESVVLLLPFNQQVVAKGIKQHLRGLESSIGLEDSKKITTSPVVVATQRPDQVLPREQRVATQPVRQKQVLIATRIKQPYTIHVGSFKNRKNALNWVRKLRKQGHTASVTPTNIPGKGLWQRVFIGFFENYNKAMRAAKELKKQSFQYAQVMKQPYMIEIEEPDSRQERKRLKAVLNAKGYFFYKPDSKDGNSSKRLIVGAYAHAKTANEHSIRLAAEGITARVVSP
jgi:tetratricopeptide (TPR) repeat protein